MILLFTWCYIACFVQLTLGVDQLTNGKRTTENAASSLFNSSALFVAAANATSGLQAAASPAATAVSTTIGTVNRTNASALPPQPDIPLSTIVISMVVYSLIFVIGFFGNAIVIVVSFFNRSRHQTTHYCLVNLSIADLLLIIVCMPSAIVDLFAKEIWYFGYFFCKLIPCLEHTIAHASILTIVAISVERSVVIASPLQAKRWFTNKRLCLVVVLIWLVSSLSTIPIMIATTYAQGLHRGLGIKVPVCFVMTNKKWQPAYLFSTLFLFYLLPCVALFVLYGKVMCVLKNRNAKNKLGITIRAGYSAAESMGKSSLALMKASYKQSSSSHNDKPPLSSQMMEATGNIESQIQAMNNNNNNNSNKDANLIADVKFGIVSTGEMRVDTSSADTVASTSVNSKAAAAAAKCGRRKQHQLKRAHTMQQQQQHQHQHQQQQQSTVSAEVSSLTANRRRASASSSRQEACGNSVHGTGSTRASRQQCGTRTGSSKRGNQKQIIILLIVMMLLILICLLPYRVFSLWVAMAKRDTIMKLGLVRYNNLITFCRVVFYINSALNPFFYHIISSKFQDSFKRFFKFSSSQTASASAAAAAAAAAFALEARGGGGNNNRTFKYNAYQSKASVEP